MRTRSLFLTLALLPALPSAAQAGIHYDRPVNIITSNYDLVDTTYIDRGRLDGVKIGDKYQVKFRDGKLVTTVIVTGVYERMASVKIIDSWLLKDGQLANYHQRPMIVALEPNERESASAILAAKKRHAMKAMAKGDAMKGGALPAAPAPAQAALPVASGNASADAGLPAAPGADMGMTAAVGVAAAPAGAGATPAMNASASADMGADMGADVGADVGAAPGASAKATASVGLPAAGSAPDAGLPPAPGSAPAAGNPAVPPVPE